MRPSRLVFVLSLAAPASFGLAGCFITAEGERYDDTYGTTDADCPIGHEGCSCTSGGSYNPGFFCNNNLNICISDACPAGSDGCYCTTGGACDAGLVCLSDFCVDPGPQCPIGTESCPCTPGGGCDNGLTCLSDTCVNADDLTTSGAPGTETSAGESSTGGAAESSSGGDSSSGMPDPDTTG